VARLFDDAASEYLEIDSTPVVAAPFTLACWSNVDDQVVQYSAMWVGDKDDWRNYWALMSGGAGNDYVNFVARSAVAFPSCATTTTWSANTWNHWCGVAAAANDRRAYLNGGGKGTNNIACSPAGADRVSIARLGDSSPQNYMLGRIAEPVIYSCALTDLEVWLLSRGVPPPLIRPQSIVAYWPLWDTDRDVWNARYHMTPFNTPSWALHPPKVLDWWRKYGNRAQTQFALKQFISRQPYNLSYHKPQAFAPTGVTRIPRHPAQYNTLAIY